MFGRYCPRWILAWDIVGGGGLRGVIIYVLESE